jgi:hypothetical protein
VIDMVDARAILGHATAGSLSGLFHSAIELLEIQPASDLQNVCGNMLPASIRTPTLSLMPNSSVPDFRTPS